MSSIRRLSSLCSHCARITSRAESTSNIIAASTSKPYASASQTDTVRKYAAPDSTLSTLVAARVKLKKASTGSTMGLSVVRNITSAISLSS